MPKSKKKPTKKALKQKQKQSQQQIVNVNIGRALREAVRRRSRPLAKSVMPPIQSTMFRVNEPAPSFFQPFSTQTAIKIPQPEPAPKIGFTMPERVGLTMPDKVKQQADELLKMFNPPTRETPFTKYMPESSMSDTEFESDPAVNFRMRNVRPISEENMPIFEGGGGGGLSGVGEDFGGITREGRIIKKVDRIWTKAPDGKFILKEGVPVPEGKIFNTDTGRFYSPFKKRSVEKKGAGGGGTKSI